jgi:beta-N-acetylhexosaminidase
MHRLVNTVLAVAFLAQPLLGSTPILAQQAPAANSPFARAAAQLAELTPAERVGQLFVVSFRGSSAAPGTEIYDLIVESHIGGVVFQASQDNFTNEANLPAQIVGLTNELQSAALGLTIAIPETPAPVETGTPDPSITAPAQSTPTPQAALVAPVPLFIAVNHEGGGAPQTQIRVGLTELPSPMSIGATWDTTHAESVGVIAGRELAALGINMLLGPSLDVLFDPRPEALGDLGSRAFGGDPYWVGRLGAAYIRGVHNGSDGRMLVMAQHFPGLGSSDRPADEEIATVLKSLEQLKQIELAPFFTVTGRAADPRAMADGLLMSHTRYQGFQGNIRQTTRPISLDPQAFAQLFALPELGAWRQAGGLVMSDSLGVRAIRRFYDPTERTFQARKITLDAFLAGNDLLLLTDFGPLPGAEQTAQIQDVISSFVQKYQNDATFAERVDAAATRILARKLQQFGDPFVPEQILRSPDGLSSIGQAQGPVFGVAQNAVTLISPTTEELAARLPVPPAQAESILIFTDTREQRQCTAPSACPPRPIVSIDAIKEDIVRLYGPGAGGVVRAGDIQSYSFAELTAFLREVTAPALPGDETPEPPPPLQLEIERADWIVFAMLNVDRNQPDSRALKDFLAYRPDTSRTQKLIAFAFDAPYYLDTTEISKLTAYYGVYSRAGAFHEVATRVLFQEITPRGASPVSISSVAYDLIDWTKPDPLQVIELFLAEPTNAQAATATATVGPGTATASPVATPSATLEQIDVGETISLRTGVIVDRNGHPVPDGTIVRFIAQYPIDGLSVSIPDVATVDGVARASFTPPRLGQIDVRVESEPAFTSITLQISIEEARIIGTIQPALPATATPEPTETEIPITPTLAATATPPEPPEPPEPIGPTPGDFLSLLAGLVILGAVGLRAGRGLPTGRGSRLALFAVVGSLVGYNYYALRLPGASLLDETWPAWGASIVTWVSGLAGLGLGWLRYGRTRAFPLPENGRRQGDDE